MFSRGRAEGERQAARLGGRGGGADDAPGGVPHVGQQRPAGGPEQEVPPGGQEDLAGEGGRVAETGDLGVAARRVLVQAEVGRLVGDRAWQQLDPAGPGDLPGDAVAGRGELRGAFGGRGQVPPGGELGAGADPLGGQARGRGQPFGLPDGRVGSGGQRGEGDGGLFQEPVPAPVGGGQPDLDQAGAEPGQVQQVLAAVVAERGVAGDLPSPVGCRAGRALGVGAVRRYLGRGGAGTAGGAGPGPGALPWPVQGPG